MQAGVVERVPRGLERAVAADAAHDDQQRPPRAGVGGPHGTHDGSRAPVEVVHPQARRDHRRLGPLPVLVGRGRDEQVHEGAEILRPADLFQCRERRPAHARVVIAGGGQDHVGVPGRAAVAEGRDELDALRRRGAGRAPGDGGIDGVRPEPAEARAGQFGLLVIR